MNSNVKDHSPKSSVSTNDDFNSKHDVDIGSIFRFYGDDYISKHSDKLTLQHRKVIRALSLCRTGELGS
mgnify:CR=1 FL=1|jgi:hypothetical protein